MRAHERGQVLAFFAAVFPVILLPLAAYAVDSAFVISRAAGLQEATAQAAEAAAQQADVDALRSRSELTIDVTGAGAVAKQSVLESEPGASVLAIQITGTVVTVSTEEVVTLPFNFLPAKAIRLEARASARLVGGYDRPSSLLPLPTNTF